MRLIPVLDIRNRQVVHAVAGQRAQYQPLVSRLVASTDPLQVARAVCDVVQSDTMYMADLDAIAQAPVDYGLIDRLQAEIPHLWLDAGIRTLVDAYAIAAHGVSGLVVGLETVVSAAELQQIGEHFPRERLLFSLDMLAGRCRRGAGFPADLHPEAAVEMAMAAGFRQMIVLDLANVGRLGGIAGRERLRRLCARWPECTWIVGGGIRDQADLAELAGWGIRAALVATALHTGQLP